MEEIKKKTFEDKLTIASIKEKEINFNLTNTRNPLSL